VCRTGSVNWPGKWELGSSCKSRQSFASVGLGAGHLCFKRKLPEGQPTVNGGSLVILQRCLEGHAA
jgi:hypothetical protein